MHRRQPFGFQSRPGLQWPSPRDTGQPRTATPPSKIAVKSIVPTLVTWTAVKPAATPKTRYRVPIVLVPFSCQPPDVSTHTAIVRGRDEPTQISSTVGTSGKLTAKLLPWGALVKRSVLPAIGRHQGLAPGNLWIPITAGGGIITARIDDVAGRARGGEVVVARCCAVLSNASISTVTCRGGNRRGTGPRARCSPLLSPVLARHGRQRMDLGVRALHANFNQRCDLFNERVGAAVFAARTKTPSS